MHTGRVFILLALAAARPGGALGAQEVFRLDLQGPSQVYANPGQVASGLYFAVLDQPAAGSGAEAWCLGLRGEEASITEITLDGTNVPNYLKGGFVSSQLTTGPGNQGAVSCAVLSPNGSATLPPGSTERIARVRVEAAAGTACKEAVIRYIDGLRPPGAVQGVNNTATRDGIIMPAEKGLKRIQVAPLGSVCYEPNPEGWIRGGAWNFLFPFTNIYGCDAGGPENMLREWVGGDELYDSFAQAGETLPPLEYQVSDGAAGFEATHFFSRLGLGEDPIWSSLEWLSMETEGRIGMPPGCDSPSHFDCDVVDYEGILDRLNVLASELGIARISTDGALAVAQTYVRNRTPTPLCVDVCFASDDSGQVRVNGKVIINRSACRGVAAGCEDRGAAILAPGVNQITVFTWEGEGDWGFRMGLIDSETGTLLTGSNQDVIDFLGTSPGGGAPGGGGPRIRREIVDPAASPLEVRLVASDVPPGGSFEVTEAYPLSGVTVSSISSGGTQAVIQGSVVIRWMVSSAALTAGLSYRVTLPPGSRVEPLGLLNGCDPIEAVRSARVLFGSWPRTGPLGFFDDSIDIGEAGRFPGGPGSFVFEAGPDGEPGTPDDEYRMRGSGDDVWDAGDAFRFAYVKVAGDFQCSVRVKGRAFPTSGGRWGRYGLMARRDTSPTAKYSLVHANLEADPGPGADHERGDGVFYQFRRNHASPAPNSQVSFGFPDPDGNGPELLNQPNWFRLIRRGPLLSGYASFDGISWKLIGSDTWYGLDPGAELLVGPMYSRHSSASEAGSVVFTDFSLGPPPPRRFFDDDQAMAGSVLFQASFDGVPDGSLPAGLVASCGGSCAFLPRVFGGRLRLSEEGAAGNAASVFLPVALPLGDASTIIIEYTAFARHSGITTRPPAGDPNPGDGLALAVLAGRSRNLVGNAGTGLGYDGISRRFDAARPSFAVEMDTWSADAFNEGTGSPGNDGAWHLGIDSGGNVNCVSLNRSSTLPDLFGNAGVRHRVVYTPDGKVTVTILPEGGGAGVGGSEPEAEGEVEPLDSQGDTTGSVAFTSGTGDATQTSEVDDLEIIIVPCSDVSERASIAGPAVAPPETLIMLDASGSDAGPGDSTELPSLVFRWSVSGDAVIEGPTDGPTVMLRTGCPVGDGEAIGRVEIDDLRCLRPVTATRDHTIAIRTGGWFTYDLNDDGDMNISDPVFHLNFLFSGGPAPACEETADYDGSGTRDITDPVACLNFLFLSTGRPPARGVGCQSHAGCSSSTSCP
jgi:hypothetical protein